MVPSLVMLLLTQAPAPASVRLVAERIETGVSKGSDAITPEIDAAALIERALEGLDAPASFRAGFIKGASQGLGKFGTQIAAAVKAGGTFTLVRLHVVDGQHRALYRLVHSEGLSYFDVLFSKAIIEPVRVIDIDVFTAGELMSQTIGRMASMAAGEVKMGVLDRLVGKEQVFVKSLPTIRQMSAATEAKDWEKAIRLYDSLPESLRGEKVLLHQRLAAASALNDEAAQLQLIEELQRRFPGDPSTDLMSVDGFVLSKRYALALAAVERLDVRVGGDPYLNVLRAGVFIPWGRANEARVALKQGIEEAPTMDALYWSLMDLELKAQNFSAVASLLSDVETKAHVRLLPPAQLPKEYRAFLASPVGREWSKGRGPSASSSRTSSSARTQKR